MANAVLIVDNVKEQVKDLVLEYNALSADTEVMIPLAFNLTFRWEQGTKVTASEEGEKSFWRRVNSDIEAAKKKAEKDLNKRIAKLLKATYALDKMYGLKRGTIFAGYIER
jgi:hypothetical protein